MATDMMQSTTERRIQQDFINSADAVSMLGLWSLITSQRSYKLQMVLDILDKTSNFSAELNSLDGDAVTNSILAADFLFISNFFYFSNEFF
ncbi:hypothetical protein CEXT_42041 [Caerostris extrusa]|uniref:Uncharacterized protein n=1 Tax=Caerostris extrusa TaxID=172846 RepID=A0AAV4Y5Q2_CAEEX|nr:hypothetical protein CEXT_42041 [Caerostris extrusa]